MGFHSALRSFSYWDAGSSRLWIGAASLKSLFQSKLTQPIPAFLLYSFPHFLWVIVTPVHRSVLFLVLGISGVIASSLFNSTLPFSTELVQQFHHILHHTHSCIQIHTHTHKYTYTETSTPNAWHILLKEKFLYSHKWRDIWPPDWLILKLLPLPFSHPVSLLFFLILKIITLLTSFCFSVCSHVFAVCDKCNSSGK